METPLNISNIGGITVEHDHDEHGFERVTISGMDFDVVAGRALDLKNAVPIDVCPEVSGPYRDLSSGCWRATVRARKEARS
jgi:hypothetical protein